MGLISWDARLETGHAKIDEQHQALVQAYNKLHQAMKQGKGRDELGGLLVFLKDYTVAHFGMEEELMTRNAYPGALRHREIHQELVTQVTDLVDRFQNSSASLTLPVMNFLESWLTNHIQGEDFRLAEFLRGKGIRG